ncbi:MAG: SUMF1/EgtB/PvdO family nonheme iron enzyme [Planctomycetota bacterium]
MIRRLRKSGSACSSVLFILLATTTGCGGSRDEALLLVELESKENTLDGCTNCGCRAVAELETGAEQRWWITFGVVAPDARGGWEAVASSSHCRSGAFDEAASDFHTTVGTPYVVLDVSTTASVLATGEVDLEVRSRIQKLSGFDGNGRPARTASTRTRRLGFAREGAITLPLFVPDERERESFGVHDVVYRLRAEVGGRGPAASYGVVSVSADVPGAEILLDGGFVGRIVENEPTVVGNVLAGAREVGVRDFSGREASRRVDVGEGGTVEVALEILDLGSAGPEDDPVPIGANPQGQEEYWRVTDGATMVRVPAGEFLMGSPDGQGQPDERPQRRVYVSEFLIDKTEVTWRQFRKFAEATGSQLPREPVWGTPDPYPVAFVLWEEARAYCEWVGGRLPTEAEWEKAARGVEGAKYPWGDEWDSRRCNSISGGLHRPESVGSYPGCVSPYGVLDMPGSMWEWCADWYGEAYYAEGPSRDPGGPTTGRVRVMRGGAWMSQPNWLRAAYRFKASPLSRNADHGFRCARDAQE